MLPMVKHPIHRMKFEIINKISIPNELFFSIIHFQEDTLPEDPLLKKKALQLQPSYQ